MICLVDNTHHETREELHKHLRKLKMRQEDYYVKVVARKDPTGAAIPFKTVDQYMAAEFASKITLKKWLKENPEKGLEWSKRWLKQRKDEKELLHPPCEVELRSLQCPATEYYEERGGYNAICRELGYTICHDGELVDQPWPGGRLICDTREQEPLIIDSVEVIKAKINCGDYGLEAAHDWGIYIERKSLQDMVGTLSSRETRAGDSNFDRFSRELDRAKECGAYIVMLVESDLNSALGFNHLPQFRWGKTQPDHIFHNLRDLLHRFDNFQVLFVDGRKIAARAVVKLLSLGEQVKRVDLQYQLASGRLKF